LVCNAGINSYKDVFDFTDDEYERIVNVNLNGTWYYCRHVGEAMAKSGGGAIVNVTSNGAFVSSYMRAPYMASKGGSHMLTRALAQDLAKYNIRVNDVAPGTIETGMTRPSERRPGYSSPPVVAMLTALHRYGKPEELAAGVAFMASDEASYIVGATLTIDGGFAAGTPLGLNVLPVPDDGFDVPWLDQFDYAKEYLEFRKSQKK
jgi:NAD(P)-dependent dehydrogenase (short-subunit alcohol dehydrogenase family)